MNKMTKEAILLDLFRITGKRESRLGMLVHLRNPEFHYLYVWRLCHSAYMNKNSVKKIFNRIRHRHYSIKYGYEIDPKCKIGSGLRLVHRGGVAINPNAVLGNNITIFKGVTIGSQSRGLKTGSPVIGNRVWIGANSTIVGKVRIGDDVLIAPNTYINFDVPSHSICIGSPAKVINRECATEGYLYNIVEIKL